MKKIVEFKKYKDLNGYLLGQIFVNGYSLTDPKLLQNPRTNQIQTHFVRDVEDNLVYVLEKTSKEKTVIIEIYDINNVFSLPSIYQVSNYKNIEYF
ncbi:MAG: hypothetical protein ACK5HL_02840 [Bacilli bacterium]